MSQVRIKILSKIKKCIEKKLTKIDSIIFDNSEQEFIRLQIRLGKVLKKYGGLSPVTEAFVNKHIDRDRYLRERMKKNSKKNILKLIEKKTDYTIELNEICSELAALKFRQNR